MTEERSKRFKLFIRVPDRSTSTLYALMPVVKGLKSLLVNGKPVKQNIINGYAEIKRTWKRGDRVELELPMEIQTITPDNRVEAVRGRIALRYGPLIYNVEKADQPDIDKYIGTGPLLPEWDKDLLGGVMTIKGKWSDGSSLVAVPNYARCNRMTKTDEKNQPHSAVWMKKQ